MRFGAAVVAAWLAITFAIAPGRADSLQLQYVVIVSRHGVRAPTWENARLNEYSAAPWPEWGVAPGELTPHGRELMALMGAYYREWLSSEGLVARTTCTSADRVYVWADAGQRTLETGKALANALMPGCGVAVHSITSGDTDPLFDPIAAGLAKPDADKAAQAVRDRLGPDPQRFLEKYRAEFETLQAILTGGAGARRQPFASLSEISVSGNGKSAELSGPLPTASTFTENLLLEYANGFRGADLGWGRLTKEQLDRVLALHGVYADLMRRTPYLARARGSNLAAHLLRSLEQSATGTADARALGRPADTLVLISGHDTNLSNLSGMLGLTWKIPGYQADETPPGGALLFSRWRDTAAREDFIRTEFVAQTLDQMRERTPLSLASPPGRTTVAIPGCGADARGCSWPVFQRILRDAIDPAFSPGP